jgi:predicted dehydrogenase
MGSNHLRVMHNMGLSIRAIVEPQPRDDFPAALKDRLISSIDDLPTDIDAAVIAVPTALHCRHYATDSRCGCEEDIH